jgi:uncharacterized protein (TIGR02996 family)
VTDEEALLRAVIADPDDDAPRLIYADWLDEHGDSDRAEFIRLQCAIAERAPHGDRPHDLFRRERELLAAHESEWSYPVGRLFRDSSLVLTGRAEVGAFRRGFIYRVVCDASVLLDCAEELFAATPLEHLRLRDARGVARELFRLPLLSRLHALDLSYNRLGDDEVYQLARCPHLKNLTFLDLAANSFEARGAHALAVSPYLDTLDVLHLGGNSQLEQADRTPLVRRFRQRVHF